MYGVRDAMQKWYTFYIAMHQRRMRRIKNIYIFPHYPRNDAVS